MNKTQTQKSAFHPEERAAIIPLLQDKYFLLNAFFLYPTVSSLKEK